ncbi:hypothetical protein NKH77_53400 [Streptomyces sp. M19]
MDGPGRGTQRPRGRGTAYPVLVGRQRGPGCRQEVRLFALAGFVVRRRTREALSWAGDVWEARRTILVRQWVTISLALASAAAGMAIPDWPPSTAS